MTPPTPPKKLCDVCNKNPSIGVGATILPYSCAYCCECAERFAQPLMVFECFYEDSKNGKELETWVNELESYVDGQYVTYREYASNRDKEQVNA